jgi:ribonuclease-3
LAAASLPANAPPTHDHLSRTDKNLPELPPISKASLARAVFTHPGAHTNTNVEGPEETSYDRLEVLGDAYIEVAATKLIWRRFPNIPAGRISQIREELVKNETLAEYATKYGFDTRLSVPPDHKDQLKRWKKTKGDVFEAYVAAVVLSNPVDGDKIVENWLTQLWQPKLTGIERVQPVLKSKEILAKKVMGKGIKLRYVDERPPERLNGGMQTFYVGVYLTGWGWENQHLGSGSGLNKTIAGDNAASQALQNIPLIDQVADAKLASDAKANDL